MLYKVLVFVDMKHMANKVSDTLVKNKITAAAIHGNKSQGARQRAIEDFRNDRLRVLVATDIAARGIDIDGITHVINYDLPHIVESYVHRIGRTARAGTEGHAISFCTVLEKSYLYGIERTTRANIKIDTDHPYHSAEVADAKVMSVGKAKSMAEAERGERSGRRPRFQRGGPRGGGHQGSKKSEERSGGGPRSEGNRSHPSGGGKRSFSGGRSSRKSH